MTPQRSTQTSPEKRKKHRRTNYSSPFTRCTRHKLATLCRITLSRKAKTESEFLPCGAFEARTATDFLGERGLFYRGGKPFFRQLDEPRGKNRECNELCCKITVAIAKQRSAEERERKGPSSKLCFFFSYPIFLLSS